MSLDVAHTKDRSSSHDNTWTENEKPGFESSCTLWSRATLDELPATLQLRL